MPGLAAATRLWRARDAATAVEMALVLPLLLVILFGIEEFGRALWIQTSLQYACEAAARCAAVSFASCANGNIPNYAASQALGMSIPSSAFKYTANASSTPAALCKPSSNTAGTGGAMVSASYRFPSVVGGLIPQLQNVTLTACSYHP